MENRRKHARYQAEVVAEVEVDDDTLIGETRDISEGGVAVLLDVSLAEGSSLKLTLVLTQDGIEDPLEDPFEVEASVMWAAPTDDDRVMLGLRFGKLAPAQEARLRRFLSALG